MIRAKVRELFEKVGGDGGYILSCCDHFFETPPENIRDLRRGGPRLRLLDRQYLPNSLTVS